VGNACIRHHCRIDTASLQSFILTPEEGDWVALEEYEKEIEDREDDYHRECPINNPALTRLDADAKEKDSD